MSRKTLRPGTHVQSHFRATWFGTVQREAGPPGCVEVRRSHDRHGRPMRKPSLTIIHQRWLQEVPELPRWPWWTERLVVPTQILPADPDAFRPMPVTLYRWDAGGAWIGVCADGEVVLCPQWAGEPDRVNADELTGIEDGADPGVAEQAVGFLRAVGAVPAGVPWTCDTHLRFALPQDGTARAAED